MSPTMRAALVFVVILGVGALMPWAGEKPPSTWFYPFLIALAIGVAIFAYRNPLPFPSPNDKPVEPVRTAFVYAAVWGLVEGGLIWTLFYLAWGDPKMWPVALVMGVLPAVTRYWHGRKLLHPVRAQIVAGAMVLFAAVIVKLILRRVS